MTEQGLRDALVDLAEDAPTWGDSRAAVQTAQSLRRRRRVRVLVLSVPVAAAITMGLAVAIPSLSRIAAPPTVPGVTAGTSVDLQLRPVLAARPIGINDCPITVHPDPTERATVCGSYGGSGLTQYLLDDAVVTAQNVLSARVEADAVAGPTVLVQLDDPGTHALQGMVASIIDHGTPKDEIVLLVDGSVQWVTVPEPESFTDGSLLLGPMIPSEASSVADALSSGNRG